MTSILPAISGRKIVAIIRGAEHKHVPDIVQSLYDGGITILEVTMNSKRSVAVQSYNFLVGKVENIEMK